MIEVKTSAGSTYLIDRPSKYWHRTTPQPELDGIRTPEGKFIFMHALTIGKPLIIGCPPLIPTADVRLLVTTPITEINNVEDVAEPRS